MLFQSKKAKKRLKTSKKTPVKKNSVNDLKIGMTVSEDTVNSAIAKLEKNFDEVKKSVSDGKSSIASAITEQGVTTESDATFTTMATNIGTVAKNKYDEGVADTKSTKVGVGAVISGDSVKTPLINKVTKPTNDTWIDAANGSAVTITPVNGVYVAVQSDKNTGTLTATPNVISEGYGTTTKYDAEESTKEVGANASSVTYVPIKGGTATTPTLGSIVQKGKLADCALAELKQLKSVDLPVFGLPTIATTGLAILITYPGNSDLYYSIILSKRS